jgi:hypothetical protein
MFSDSYAAAAAPRANEGTDLPATFGESFADSWQAGQLATSGIRQENARAQAVSEYVDQINGAQPGAVDAEYAKQLAEGGSITTSDGGTSGGPDLLEVANGVVAKMKASADAAGTKLPFAPMSSDDIDNRAVQITRGAMASNAAMQARPQTWGSVAGSLAGSVAAGGEDPYNIPLMLIAPESFLPKVAGFAAANAASQAVNEGVNAAYNEKVMPGYAASGQALRNIGEAGVQGAGLAVGAEALGFGVKLAGNVLGRTLTRAWPTATRDAANAVMSEANILDTNALHGAEGEAAHQGALGQSIDQILRGAPVDVSRDIPADSGFARTIGDIPTGPREISEPVGGGTAESYIPDTVRFYEAPAEGEAPARLTPISADVDARFVDIPNDHPAISGENAPGLDAASGAYRPFEAPADLTARLESPALAVAEPAADVRPGSLTGDQIREQLAAPETLAAMRADVERAIDEAAQGGKELQTPTGLRFTGGYDKMGAPIMDPSFRSVADQLAEVDRMNALADQIAACATPMAMAAE